MTERTTDTSSSAASLQRRPIVRTVLPNGLTVLTKEVPQSPVVSTIVFYRVGSRNEEAGQTGKSHFLEHMLFKGTTKYPKGSIDHTTLVNGGANNAFTSEDCTAYYFDFSADRFDVALDIEAQRMVDTQFFPEEFEHEKQVVIEELKINLDSPWGALGQEVRATAFKVHPYRHPVVGWIEDLAKSSRQEMEAYYRRFYHPNNAILVLVGGFATDRVLRTVESTFGVIPRGADIPPVKITEPPQQGEKRVTLKRPSQIERIHMAYHAPSVSEAEGYALRLAALTLSGGRSSRLYQRMIERERSAVSVSVEFSESVDPTLLEVRAEVVPEKTLDGVEAAISEEASRLQEELLTQNELEKTKNMIEAHFEFGRERTLNEAIQMGYAEAIIGYEHLDTYVDRIRAVTAEEVRGAAQKYLGMDNRTVGWLRFKK
ncbi:MAG: insulinase family protein [Acidobacteriia bacterium]|nr:insulinase family protein [Terriglobia bacterium]